MDVFEVIRAAKVVPVVTVESVEQAVGVAGAFWDGGLGVIEITLRTSAGLDGIRAVAGEYPEMFVGAGTVLSDADVNRAVDAGASFLVTPGTPAALADSLAACGVAAIPGAQTVSEVMALRSRGFDVVKLFPAEACGGVGVLKAMAGPLPDVRFVPTGGIGRGNAGDYLALGNVLAVGGSWLAPKTMMAAGDWDGIRGNVAGLGASL